MNRRAVANAHPVVLSAQGTRVCNRQRTMVGWKIIAPLTVSLLMSACSVLEKPTRSVLYDFGPGPRQANAVSQQSRPAVQVAEVETSSALDNTAMWYRLAYADAQQILPYSHARWSMPPAQLLRQRLRAGLEQPFALADRGSTTGELRQLQIQLLEFSQLFSTPEHSVGLVRVHAAVVGTGPAGERPFAARNFVVERPAATADAAGGARSLSAAVDGLQEEIAQWLKTLH